MEGVHEKIWRQRMNYGTAKQERLQMSMSEAFALQWTEAGG